MARVARIAGAILAESNGEHFLVGQTKEPCNFAAHGLVAPGPLRAPWFVRLETSGPVTLAAPYIELAVEGEALAAILAQRFVIERNGSVSERLWRMVLAGGDPDGEEEPPPALDARWLGEIPAPFWQLVRDTVLRCL